MKAALEMIEVGGAIAAYAGDPIDENPYDPDRAPAAYDAWSRGWKSVHCQEGHEQDSEA